MDTIVVQISRGVAPIESVANAVIETHKRGGRYAYVTGLPAHEAKLKAAVIARECHANLLLMEDDVRLDSDQWDKAFLDDGVVKWASARCRDGKVNTKRNKSGEFLYTGTVFVRVPYSILMILPEDPFVPMTFRYEGEDIVPAYRNDRGKSSDIFFWYCVRNLDPIPELEDLGMCVHMKHPLNSGKYVLNEPCEIGAW